MHDIPQSKSNVQKTVADCPNELGNLLKRHTNLL